MAKAEELREVAAWAINGAWNEIGDVPFPLYQAEAEKLGGAAVRAVLTCFLDDPTISRETRRYLEAHLQQNPSPVESGAQDVKDVE